MSWTRRSARPALIGRTGELARLEELADGGVLATIVGPPGIGKTSLARALAARIDAAALPGGIHVCELSEAASVADVCRAVAMELDLSLVVGTDDVELADQLGCSLAAIGPALIVLDNFEQIAEHAAATVGHWREVAPAVSFVVTSRVHLRLDREQIVELGPLPETEAIELFVRRARRAREEFELTAGGQRTVARLVHQLDRNPLAIELAAARMGVLTPEQLASYLPHRMGALGHGDGGEPRHASLDAALAWSWQLLSPWEREALAQLGVFRGGFSVDAAAAVVVHAGDAPWIVDVLQSLRDKSLLQSRTADATPGELRFSMFVGVREYASERATELGVADAAARRHARFFADRAAAWARRFEATSDRDAGARLSLELDNLLAAHRRCLDTADAGDAAVAVELALAVAPLLARTGPFGLRYELVDDALTAAGEALDSAVRARALVARGDGLRALGRMAESIAALEAGGALAEELGDLDTAARARSSVGLCHVVEGDFAATAEHLERSLGLARDARSDLLVGRAVAWLGHLDLCMRELARGWNRYGDALPLLRRAGDRRHEGIALASMAAIAHEGGRLAEARALYEEALEIHREVADPRYASTALANLGLIAQERADYPAALRRFEDGIALAVSTGDRRVEGVLLGYYARIGQELDAAGEPSRGLLHTYDRALERLSAGGDAFATALVRAFRASLEADLGNIRVAREQASEAAAALDDAGHRYAVAASLCAVHADVAEARALAASGDPAAAEVLARASRAVDDLAGRAGEVLDESADARIALALVRSRIATAAREHERPAPAPRVLAEGASPTLEVAPDARWFRLPTGEYVSLHRRRALRLILDRLVHARLADPEQKLSVEALKEAGWPGERIDPEAGRRRVYTALWTLRKLGLKDVLTKTDDGYHLDARVEIPDGATSSARF